MKNTKQKSITKLEKIALMSTEWIGSTESLVIHTIIFIGSFLIYFLGVDIQLILLVLTTVVSLEAIYLAIFIQMSVNRQGTRLEAVSEDIEEIQEDVEEIQKDVEGIEEDIDEIQEDVEGIEKDIDEIQKDVDEIQEDVEGIEEDIEGIEEDIETKPTNDKDSKIIIEKDIVELIKNMNQKISDLQDEIKTLTKKLPPKKSESIKQKVTRLLKK